jgi:hypothetical protein
MTKRELVEELERLARMHAECAKGDIPADYKEEHYICADIYDACAKLAEQLEDGKP